MIIRIVKMTFRAERVSDFLELFESKKLNIRNFPGVEKLELFRNKDDNCVFFTYSVWTELHDLENYRRSELFKSVWEKTREMFECKAEAWTVDRLSSL